MNGAESLVRTLLGSGVDTCFANPGTSEMHFVAALDKVPGMRCVLGLAETVVTGCADGYARMRGKPATTLLHCGPGFANGIANVHNAARAYAPMVNVVGDHATYHRQYDTPLTSDVEGLDRVYKILQGELINVGARPGPASDQLFDLSRPAIDWVQLAGSLGVEATQVENLEAFADVFGAACGRRGPFLIEFRIARTMGRARITWSEWPS